MMTTEQQITVVPIQTVLGCGGAPELWDNIQRHHGKADAVVAVRRGSVIDHIVIGVDDDGDYCYDGAGDMFWRDLDAALAAAAVTLADRHAR